MTGPTGVGARVAVWVVTVAALAGVGLAVLQVEALELSEGAAAIAVAAFAVSAAVTAGRGHAGGLPILGAALGAAAALVAALAPDESWWIDGGWRVGAAGVAAAAGLATFVVPSVAAAIPFRGAGRRRALVVAVSVAGVSVLAVNGPHDGYWPALVAAGAAIAVLAPSARARYLQAGPAGRARARLLLAAAAITGAALVAAVNLRVVAGAPRDLVSVAALAGLTVPVALVVGPRLLLPAADRLARRGVLAAVVAVVLIAVYLLVLVGLGRVPDADERDLVVRSAVAAALAAGLVLPLRGRISAVVAHLVGGEADRGDVARLLGDRAALGLPRGELLLQTAEALVRGLGCRWCEVWVVDGGALTRAEAVPAAPLRSVEIGDAGLTALAGASVAGPALLDVWAPGLLDETSPDHGAVLVAAASFGGELQGLVVVAIDEGAAEIEPLLADVGRQLGSALANTRLGDELDSTLDDLRRQAEELRASRRRIVTTADAERKRIEQDLHDGAQQHLTALAVNLEVARSLVRDDPTEAERLLDAIRSDLAGAVAELRRLAHGVYPPTLRDQGLEAALRESATRHPTRVTVDGHAPPLDDQVAAAVYFCCLEALVNAAKHAPDAEVSISLGERQGGLVFAVTDGGGGFDVGGAGGGNGLLNMRDRVGAVGGSVRIESGPDGTRVEGVVPIGR